MAMPQVQVFYSGQVQGVGFRFAVESLSRQFVVTGWVRNLADGRVELVAEGRRAEVEKFLQAVDEEFPRHIRDRHISWTEVAGSYAEFSVRS
jgi:acylphosphatase